MITYPLSSNLTADERGHLLFAGQDTVELARRWGTPLYLMDEDRIRENCRVYRESMKNAFGDGGQALYASKAASFRQIYRIVAEEGLGADVVSPGEIATAAAAGFPMEKTVFHSNNKTDEDIAFALKHGVGRFVIDSTEELTALDAAAGREGIRQKIWIRITPGIDPHTYAAVATGKVDSKFGFAVQTGQAEQITKAALSLRHVELEGFHCHVGSQVFDSDVYLRCAEVMLDWIAHVRRVFGFTAQALDLGGGYGVRYTENQPQIDLAANIAQVGAYLHRAARERDLPLPRVFLEPGRSIVADAGLTLYTVGSVKKIPGFVNYVSVDGGMTDNPRYALYQAPYTVLSANRAADPADLPCTLVGRCCESGDVLQPDVKLPADTQRGDVVAVCTTGAYNYSMASNYNRIPRPPVVMLKNGDSYAAVRRETMEDLLRLDL